MSQTAVPALAMTVGNGVAIGTAATVQGTGTLNLDTSLYVNGIKVVGAAETGWTVPTGTAQRSGFATYTSPNISAAYVEAEVQALADVLQDVSRTLMAVITDLHITAGHGLLAA